jgi:hypothetical protein
VVCQSAEQGVLSGEQVRTGEATWRQVFSPDGRLAAARLTPQAPAFPGADFPSIRPERKNEALWQCGVYGFFGEIHAARRA